MELHAWCIDQLVSVFMLIEHKLENNYDFK